MVPVVVRLDPANPGLSLLLPFLAERVRLFAEEYEPRVNPQSYSSLVMGRIWARDPTILALGLVDPEKGTLHGHVLAEMGVSRDLATGAEVKSAIVTQKRADGNVGDALYQAVEEAGVWAVTNGASVIALNTRKDSREWEKRLGYTHGHHVLFKKLGMDE